MSRMPLPPTPTQFIPLSTSPDIAFPIVWATSANFVFEGCALLVSYLQHGLV